MNKKTDKGIILSRTDFGESDRILTVLLKENGKARVVAKGVRKTKSKMAGGIELLSEAQLGFIQGRGEMLTLTSSRLISHFGNIVQDYDKTQLAYEVLRTVNKVVDDGHGQDYYPLILSSLEYMDEDKLDQYDVRIWFYMTLLKLMGNSINLKTDSKGQALEEADKYSFDREGSCFYASGSGTYSKDTVKLLRVVEQYGRAVSAGLPDKQKGSLSNLLQSLTREAVG